MNLKLKLHCAIFAHKHIFRVARQGKIDKKFKNGERGVLEKIGE